MNTSVPAPEVMLGWEPGVLWWRVLRIQRHVTAARLEHSQQSNHHGGRTFQQDPDSMFSTNSDINQMMGQLIGASVEFSVSENAIAKP